MSRLFAIGLSLALSVVLLLSSSPFTVNAQEATPQPAAEGAPASLEIGARG
jgi:hypothetical protein